MRLMICYRFVCLIVIVDIVEKYLRDMAEYYLQGSKGILQFSYLRI